MELICRIIMMLCFDLAVLALVFLGLLDAPLSWLF